MSILCIPIVSNPSKYPSVKGAVPSANHRPQASTSSNPSSAFHIRLGKSLTSDSLLIQQKNLADLICYCFGVDRLITSRSLVIIIVLDSVSSILFIAYTEELTKRSAQQWYIP